MSFLKKIFKKSKDAEESKPEKTDQKLKERERAVSRATETPDRERKNALHGPVGVISHPHVTEKTSSAAKANQYAFAVSREVNKARIRQAVEARYGVSVTAVRVMNTSGKERRRGKQIGWKPGFKKALVTLKEGQKIEMQ